MATVPASTIRSAQEIFSPYFCLHGPQQSPGLVEVGVVGPAVERLEALLAAPGAAASVADAVGAGAVPGHADEQRSVVAPVRRPPVLRIVHHLLEVCLQRVEIERGESGGVVEVLAEGVGFGTCGRRHGKRYGQGSGEGQCFLDHVLKLLAVIC
jgi:hypothetical protein